MPTLSQRADQLMGLLGLGPPFKITKVLEDTKDEVIVRFDGNSERDLEMKMNFQSTPEHRATTVYAGGPGSQFGPKPKQYLNWTNLSDLLTQIKSDTGVPALSAAYYDNGAEDDAVVGEREINKPARASIDDRWLIGSITKSMTAYLIGRLVDRGLLRWDTTLEQALPGMPMRPEYRGVTILQLLHHRSGVPQDKLVDPPFLERAAGDSLDRIAMRDHYARFTLSREPIAKPDGKLMYSNAGYALLSHIAETVAKQPYEQLMHDLVFGPLEMKSAQFGVPGAPGNPGATGELMGHLAQDGKFVPHVIDEYRLSAIQAGAGLGVSMTISDLLRFVKANLNGLRGRPNPLSQTSFDVLHKTVGPEEYACGWLISRGVTKTPYIGHNGSDGTFMAEMAIWPERNLAIVAISNAGSVRTPNPPLQALKAIYDRHAK